jgi:uncharacterized membrane protein YbhN (UPF0104 family)
VSRGTARALIGLARLAVTLGAAWLIFRHVDWAVLYGLLARADPIRLALAGLVLAVQFAIIVWRWQLIIEVLGGGAVAAGPLAVALGRSMLIGQPLPSTLGGDAVRMLELSRRTGIALAARSVICDRVTALAVLVALVVVTLPCFAWLVEAGPAFLVLAAVALGAAAAIGLVLAQPRLLGAVPWLGGHAVAVAADARQALLGGTRGHLVFLLALVTQLFGVLLIYQLARALAAPVTLLDCLLIVPPTLVVSAIPISLGGWGVREGALAAGFVLIGATSEAGVATSVLFGLTGPLIGVITELVAPLIRRCGLPPRDAA